MRLITSAQVERFLLADAELRAESRPECIASKTDGRVMGWIGAQFDEFSIEELDVVVLEECPSGPQPAILFRGLIAIGVAAAARWRAMTCTATETARGSSTVAICCSPRSVNFKNGRCDF